MPAKILIADDNSVTRKAIRFFLGWHSFQICGEARCGKEAVAKVREFKPDILLLGINMPDMNGIRTAYEILRVSRSTKIVFLSVHDTPGTMKAARMGLTDSELNPPPALNLSPHCVVLLEIDQQLDRKTKENKLRSAAASYANTGENPCSR